ncbi:MAG: hypothetical protein ACE5LC_08855 [Candidatus Aminicenantales bacterium]
MPFVDEPHRLLYKQRDGDEKTRKIFEPRASRIKGRLDALKKIYESGIRTFAFIGPILPGNPQNLAELLEGKVSRVLIDRMNYIKTFKSFYLQHNLTKASTENFFSEYRDTLLNALEKKGINHEVLF